MRPILIILPQDWTRPGWFLLPRCCYQSTVEQILKEEMWRIWKYSGNRWVLSPASSNMWDDHNIFPLDDPLQLLEWSEVCSSQSAAARLHWLRCLASFCRKTVFINSLSISLSLLFQQQSCCFIFPFSCNKYHSFNPFEKRKARHES